MAELTINEVLTRWADMTIRIWAQKMADLNISNAAFHANSFAHAVITAAGGDYAKVEFTFNYFLKFTDMGVGKGVSQENRATVITTRIPKQWYTKTFLLEVRKLSNILAQHYAFNGVLLVKENMASIQNPLKS
jgi:hypothetical protein